MISSLTDLNLLSICGYILLHIIHHCSIYINITLAFEKLIWPLNHQVPMEYIKIPQYYHLIPSLYHMCLIWSLSFQMCHIWSDWANMKLLILTWEPGLILIWLKLWKIKWVLHSLWFSAVLHQPVRRPIS